MDWRELDKEDGREKSENNKMIWRGITTWQKGQDKWEEGRRSEKRF